MLRFIICEDNAQFLERVSTIVNKAMMVYNFDYKISKFKEYNKEVEEIIKNENEQKIYILDIELPKVSGLEMASIIRENDLESIIIFLTAHNECRNDVFYSRLLALDYIPKDRIWTERFENTIKHTVKALNNKRVLLFDFNYNSYRVPLKDIIYIEKVQDQQKCLIHTDSGENYEIISGVAELAKKLGPCFYQSHKACIVNVEKIKSINYTDGIITFFNNESVYLLSTRQKKGLKEYVSHY